MKKHLSLILLLLWAVLSVAAEITLVSPQKDAVVPLLNPAQKAFLDLSIEERIDLFSDQDARDRLARKGGQYPSPVRLVWSAGDDVIPPFTVRLSTTPDFQNPTTLSGDDRNAKVDNLMIHRRYYWDVSARDRNGAVIASDIGTFLTEDRAPRLLRVDGVANIRDLGGRKTDDGKRVRQNLIFRSGGLNGNASPVYEKDADGKTVMIRDATGRSVPKEIERLPGRTLIRAAGRVFLLQTVGIKTEIDLRSDGEVFGMTGSPLGPSVQWLHYSSSSYGGMQTPFGKAQFAKTFRVLCDRKNYPVLFHCIAGQDRTGSVAYLLNGLLGVDENELYRDWEVSGFVTRSAQWNHTLLFNQLLSGLEDNCSGDNEKSRIESYLKSCGITDAEIAAFRAIMLEDDVQP